MEQALPGQFPRTRYQGSKARLVDWIVETLAPLEATSVLDAFGGTGVVAYRWKQLGRRVTCNDILPFNAAFARALIENNDVVLTDAEVQALVEPAPSSSTWIQDTFADIYYTDRENAWLDAVATHLDTYTCDYKRALAFFAVAQACIVKRPFNLFHRKNLYLRLADVERSFGNKASWDRSFASWVRELAQEANAAVFPGQHPCRATQHSAEQVPGDFDLIYADPPYISAKGNAVDYADFYHFLVGLYDVTSWPERVDYRSKHRRMRREPSPWTDKHRIHQAFDDFFAAYPGAALAVSYRSDGIPTPDELKALLLRHRRRVKVHSYGTYTYALSKNQRSRELLFVATD